MQVLITECPPAFYQRQTLPYGMVNTRVNSWNSRLSTKFISFSNMAQTVQPCG